jgi:hypothetical protein
MSFVWRFAPTAISWAKYRTSACNGPRILVRTFVHWLLLGIKGISRLFEVCAEKGAHTERAQSYFSVPSRRARELHQAKVALAGEEIDR